MSLFVLSVFPFFSADFRGSVGITKSLCFWGSFPFLVPKKNKGRTVFGTPPRWGRQSFCRPISHSHFWAHFPSLLTFSSLNYPLRRNDYQNDSVNIFSCNCPGVITGFSCRAPENDSPKRFSCMSPCPVRAPPVIAPGALTGFSCRAPKNNSKIIFSCL